MAKTWLTLLLLFMAAHGAWADGCKIADVKPHSPAEAAGLKSGDILLAANDHEIKVHDDLVRAVRSAVTELKMRVQRGDKTESLTAHLGSKTTQGNHLGVQCFYGEDEAAALEEAKRNFVPTHSFSVGAGGVIPVATLDTDFIGAGKQTVGGPGYTVGSRYLYGFGPTVEAGLEGNYVDLGGHSFSMYPFEAELSMQSTVLLALAKFHAPPKPITPYVITGLGAHISEFTWDVAPSPGLMWASGSPNDARPLVSGKKVGFAMALGMGVDVDFAKNYFWSLEGRFDYLAKTSYEGTPLGQSVGIMGADVPGGHFGLMAHVGWRFSEGPSPDSAAPGSAPSPAPSKPGMSNDGLM